MATGKVGSGSVAGGGGPRASRVRRTGLALVHEGELVLPAAGSEAAASVVVEDDRTVVNYYFPVEIEIRTASSAGDQRSEITRAFASMADGLDSFA